MKKVIIIFLCFAFLVFVQCTTQKNENKQNTVPIPEMSIQELDDVNYLYTEVTGSFEKHPELIARLNTYLMKSEIDGKNLTGIYPEDPDAVPTAELDWEIGFEVPARLNNVQEEGFEIRVIKRGTALVVESTVAYSATHGLYCKVWLLEHGYVQIQPTRMVYHQGYEDPMQQRTTIIFPVVKRSRDIPVISNSTLNHSL